jgi:hypothetical protein
MMESITGGVVNSRKNHGVLFPESSGSNREYYYHSKIFKDFERCCDVFRYRLSSDIISVHPHSRGTDNHG